MFALFPGRNSKFNEYRLKFSDAKGDSFWFWCSPTEREYDAHCVACSQIIDCSQHGVFAASVTLGVRDHFLRGVDARYKCPQFLDQGFLYCCFQIVPVKRP